ncbi:hypothetical protein [Clostridium sp. AM58-1XD]|uniref:hypothetical protein n=1 Tax=Clostridium sp. AM58-1XD TaxID=2292307 RepID=UPI000E4FF611|nr:hypothetical protein [Clostridium sp. AM58-1XD]RGY95379.1 hypothetical protein DXA13_19355 [Clostridium sp. AM58-1XD]
MLKTEFKGTAKLAAAMHNRIKLMGEAPPVMELGMIGSDMSLITDSFKQAIPASDYLVCRSVAYDAGGEFTTDSNGDSVRFPETFRNLKPGDRVLTAWMGNEAVVIDLILPASRIGKGG